MKKELLISFFIISALVFFSGCAKAKKYKITGTWILSRSFDNIEVLLLDTEIEFIGNEFSGTVTIPVNSNFGTYSVSVSNEINFNLNNGDATYTGTWIDDYKIGGTFYWKERGDTGTWSATR